MSGHLIYHEGPTLVVIHQCNYAIYTYAILIPIGHLLESQRPNPKGARARYVIPCSHSAHAPWTEMGGD